ncbi:protocadherin gamma-A11-like [Latimeria chalumnae]|uniref:protocadherin gamma-A11-like n=1 Tax=Latimeria chalumnae TaxID=7897 RepID=UPI00313CE324
MEIASAERRYNLKGQVFLFVLLLLSPLSCASEKIRYSIPEEMEEGSVVGNIAKDLGLNIRELSARGVRVVSRTKTQYFTVNVENGNLLLNENIDREQICTYAPQCLLTVQILVENPMHLYPAEVEIQDINDNAPMFPEQEIVLEISEITEPGTRFPFDNAHDPDIGVNSLQSYVLSPNYYFIVLQTSKEGEKYAELVLEKALDREKEAVHVLSLTAMDGGLPVKSSTVKITIIVLDANDNAPLFTERVYKVSLQEGVSVGAVVLQVNAIDVDEGSYGEVTYSFNKISEKARQVFEVDSKTGEVIATGKVDFEEASSYEIEIRAKDGGGLTAYCKVLLEIIDINDNPPVITVTSFSTSVSEDSLPGTVIALLNVDDPDSGENGKVLCFVPPNFPFNLTSSIDNFYTLATDRVLDRELVSEYNITIIAIDRGVPSLTTSKSVLLKISDINDNPPIFNQTSYTAYVNENNPPGSFICSVKATDLDWDQNARLTYYITETQVHGKLVSSYISINPENGNIQALRSFDHEQFRDFHIQVIAQDAGSPPLSSNVIVNVFILDQNDNAPEILYPPRRDGASAIELTPRSAKRGYLVTKVVAVDADSGQNAWLSYKLLKATESNSFSIGLHSGEVRTARLFLDKDIVKQTLTILVKDNGQPSLSATVTLSLLVADNFPKILPDLDRLSANTDHSSNLRLYLVISLASVSLLFLVFIIVLTVIKIRHWRSSRLFHSLNSRAVPIFPPCYAEVDGSKPTPQTYCYEVHQTINSNKSEFNYLKLYGRGITENNPPSDALLAELQRQEQSSACKNSDVTKESARLCADPDPNIPVIHVSCDW